jgi:hypothetical protein
MFAGQGFAMEVVNSSQGGIEGPSFQGIGRFIGGGATVSNVYKSLYNTIFSSLIIESTFDDGTGYTNPIIVLPPSQKQ